jgi:hypothetical protein
MKTSEILSAAKKLIETPDKWTKGAFGRTSEGHYRQFPEEVKDAVCWCAGGAIKMIAPNFSDTELAWQMFERAVGIFSIPPWNDSEFRTHDEVMAGFDKAIALARSEEGG